MDYLIQAAVRYREIHLQVLEEDLKVRSLREQIQLFEQQPERQAELPELKKKYEALVIHWQKLRGERLQAGRAVLRICEDTDFY